MDIRRLLKGLFGLRNQAAANYDGVNEWCYESLQCLNQIVNFFESNHIDDIRDSRVRNQMPQFAKKLHTLVVDAPVETPKPLRDVLHNFSKTATTITLALDHPELESGMLRNEQKDDQAANEIISEVLLEDGLYKPVKEGIKLFEGFLESSGQQMQET